jgi:hypothetical protein
MSKTSVTVVIPTLNEESRIRGCLDSVRWASEVIVVDGGSDDRTVEIAKECGVRVMVATDITIGAQRNLAIESAANTWILALDADELCSVGLEQFVSSAVVKNFRLVFSVLRKNCFKGKEVRWGGWGGDRVVRLFPATERFDARRVHEKLDSSLPVERTSAYLDHFPYEGDGDFERKLKRYATWGAADLVDSGRSFFGLASWVRPPARVFRMLFLQLGFLDGSRGLKLSWMAARSVRQKYLLAREMVRTQRHR